MATYIIGDIQGCFAALQRLLQKINFNTDNDTLWFCGDLIARGPQSLECLNFIKGLGKNAVCVLGNHDLHFIASYYGFSTLKASDKLQPLQQAANLDELVHWLCQQPLIHTNKNMSHLMVHAGLSPQWQLEDALSAAAEVSQVLQQNPKHLLSHMYGNQPISWGKAYSQQERWRFTINACTRMRFCHADGSLELKEKGNPQEINNNLVPWYEFWRHRAHPELFFGHWASLNGYSPVPNIHALDTACVWGNTLTAYCIEKQQRYSVAA